MNTASIADGAATDAKIGTITTAGRVANSATTATSANTASAIVARNASGDFSASAITATQLTVNGTLTAVGVPVGSSVAWNAGQGSFGAGTNVITSAGGTGFGENVNASGSGLAAGLNVQSDGAGATALGVKASATVGSFVFGDNSSGTTVNSTGTNTFVVRAANGTTFYSASDLSSGVSLAAGAGSWSTLSNVRSKTEFRLEDPEFFLKGIAALALQSWRYKSQGSAIRHVGPTAQDFRAAFNLGESDTTIATVDADGASMLAIQALARRTDALRLALDRVATLGDELERVKASDDTMRRRNAELVKQVSEQEQRLRAIEAALQLPGAAESARRTKSPL